MGVNLKELVPRREISFEELSGKVLAVDAYNILYQFLTTIRTPTGELFKDSKGRVTSHLIGLFSRTTNFLKHGLKPVFVFDGKMPDLKHKEIMRRKKIKAEAAEKYKEAAIAEDIEAMKKYAARTALLTKDMVKDAKELLTLLGVPVIQAPSEGEAQAAHIVKKKDAWAVVSQDYDSLLCGATRLIQNLSISGRRKKTGTLQTVIVKPQIIELKEVLKTIGVTQDKLIALAMLVGTDYHPGGVKGIGPKKALALVKECKSVEEIFTKAKWEEHCNIPWKEIFTLFKDMNVTDEYEISFSTPKEEKLIDFLVKERKFGEERVRKTLSELKAKAQKSLGEF